MGYATYIAISIVDGSEISNNHQGCIKPCTGNNGRNYLLTGAGFHPSTVQHIKSGFNKCCMPFGNSKLLPQHHLRAILRLLVLRQFHFRRGQLCLHFAQDVSGNA